MKFIATRAFLNTHKLDLNKDGEVSEHERHVPKGAIFEIGTATEFRKLSAQEQELVALLNHARCIGDSSNTDLVKRIRAEVANEKKLEERARATAVAAGSGADVVNQLIAALKESSGAGARKPAA